MTGSIIRRGERSWRLKFDVGADNAGKRKTRYVTFRGTKAEAQRELVRLLAAEQSGQGVDPTRETVAEFLTRWLRDWSAVNMSPKTHERFGEIVRLHVFPHIGAKRIQKLTSDDLVALYATLKTATGLAPRTILHVHRLLFRAFGHARKWRVAPTNVAADADTPNVEDVEVSILQPGEAQAVLTALRGKTLYPIVATALGTGMRRGELLALRWQDVDLDRATLRVERSLEQTKAGLRFKAPKTKHGRRAIALPAYLVADLRAHWKMQQEQRLALGAGKSPPDSLVFATFEAKPKSPNALTKEWSVAAKALGVKVSFHGLRHTHASQLIASGMDVLTISRRLGHGTPTITLAVYGHLFTNSDDRAAQVLDAAFSSARTENQ
jgi:integrase